MRAGRDPAELAREFEPTAHSICHWVTQADRQERRREEKSDGLASAERDELARLRRENKQLRLECGSASPWDPMLMARNLLHQLGYSASCRVQIGAYRDPGKMSTLPALSSC